MQETISVVRNVAWVPTSFPPSLFIMLTPINLEFPLLVTSGTEAPPDGPPPYSSDDETGDLIFSKEEATYEQWRRYHVWLQEQKEWWQDPEETAVILRMRRMAE
jgi:hypothetical protein